MESETISLKNEVKTLRAKVDPNAAVDLSPEAIAKYKEVSESFLDGRIEQIDIQSLAEAHVYLEFVRQMKDLHTKNFLK